MPRCRGWVTWTTEDYQSYNTDWLSCAVVVTPLCPCCTSCLQTQTLTQMTLQACATARSVHTCPCMCAWTPMQLRAKGPPLNTSLNTHGTPPHLCTLLLLGQLLHLLHTGGCNKTPPPLAPRCHHQPVTRLQDLSKHLQCSRESQEQQCSAACEGVVLTAHMVCMWKVCPMTACSMPGFDASVLLNASMHE